MSSDSRLILGYGMDGMGAESDFRSLIRAREIQGDSSRLAGAKKFAAENVVKAEAQVAILEDEPTFIRVNNSAQGSGMIPKE